MSSKGTSGHPCCCSGCHDVPWGEAIPTAEQESERRLQPIPLFCCACVPKIVCFTYDACGVTTRAVLRLDKCLTRPYGVDGYGGTGYTGEITVNGDNVDIQVQFVVQDETCLLVLSSVDLGIDGTDPSHQIVLDEYNRDRICGSTSRCLPCGTCGYFDPDDFADGECFEWSVDIASCGYGGTFRLCPAATTTLVFENRSACPECEPLNPDRPRCGTLCDGCSCICSEACITVSYQHIASATNIVTTERARLIVDYLPRPPVDPYEDDSTSYGCDRVTNAYATYETESGVIIQLRPNSITCECELMLLAWPYDMPLTPSALTTPQPVLIGGSDLDNTCPTPTAAWVMLDASDPTRTLSVVFSCATCKECEQIAVPECCEFGSGSIPRVLTATLITDADCCGTHSITLVYDGTNGWWSGRAENIWAAEGPYCDKWIELTLSCGNPNWSMNMTTNSVCLPFSPVSASTATCDPVSLVFAFEMTGPGCCHEFEDPMVGPSTASITVIVTE